MNLLPFLCDGAPKATVLLAHGFGEYHGRYLEFISALNNDEYDVWTFDFTGHGSASGPRGQVNVGRLIGEHLEAREELLRKTRTKKIFLFGHSMGGLVSLASTLLSPTHIAGTAVTGPALRPLPQLPQTIAKIGAALGNIFPQAKSVEIDHTKLSHDQQVVAQYGNDPLVYQGKVPLITGATMMIQGEYVIRNAPLLTVPTLIMHGSEDVLADVDGSTEFVARAPKYAHLEVISGAYHEVLNEIERATYSQEIIEWYDRW